MEEKLVKWVRFAKNIAYMLRNARGEGGGRVSIFTIVAVTLYSKIHEIPVLVLHLLDEDVEDLIGKKVFQPVLIKTRRLVDDHTGLRELIEEEWRGERIEMEKWYIAEVILDNITIYALLVSDALEVLREGGGDVVVVVEGISDMRGEVVYRELLLGERGTIAFRGKLEDR